MKCSKIFIPIVALLVLCSCFLGAKNIEIDAPGYVSYYINMCKCRIMATSEIEDGALSINIVLYAQQASSVNDYAQHKTKSHYYKICQKYDDLYYNQHIEYSTIPGMSYNNGVSAFAESVTGISIVSDDNWDSEHPSGTPLNDIFSVKYVTLYPYVQSHYKAEEIRTSVDIPLSDIADNDLKMLVPYKIVEFDKYMQTGSGLVKAGSAFLELYTDKLPKKRLQSLHITLTTDEGKNIEYTVELDLQ